LIVVAMLAVPNGPRPLIQQRVMMAIRSRYDLQF